MKSPFDFVIGAVAGEGAGHRHVAAAAASGSGGDEAGREAAERMARREDHGGRDGRKGIHGEFKLMSLTKKKKKRSWKKQKERKKSWSLGCEDFFVKVKHLIFPADFIVIDIEDDANIPLILGRPFMSTAS